MATLVSEIGNHMIVTICGSIAFIEEMYDLKQKLEDMGYEVLVPPNKHYDKEGKEIAAIDYYHQKKEAFNDNEHPLWQDHGEKITNHFNKVAAGDVVLIANYDKNGVDNYIGPNTLMEMGVAFHLGKKIFLLNPIPNAHYKEEILGMKPIIINGDLSLIK